MTPWDVQSRRIFEETGTWPTLYGGEGGGHGYIQTEEKRRLLLPRTSVTKCGICTMLQGRYRPSQG